MTISQYFLMFLIYSFVGWVIEVINMYYQKHRFINRGFLVGPYCPIYGIGSIIVTLVVTQYKEHQITLFVMSMFICAILEYFTSFLMEKMFKARWWDYSNRKFNINGRISLETLVPFGVLGCFIIYISNPMLIKFCNLFSSNFITILALILAILFIVDIFVSLRIITNFRKAAGAFMDKDNTEEIGKKVKDTLESASKLLNNRLVKAFPNVKKTIDDIADNMRKLKAEMDRNSESKKKLSFLEKVKKYLIKKNKE